MFYPTQGQDRCTWSVVSENAARNQLAPTCAQRRSQKVNQATPSLSHSPVKAPVPVRTHCTNAWWNRCKTDPNSFPCRKLEETTGTSSCYMDEDHWAGSEIQRPHYERCSRLGSEPSTLEIDVYIRRYALLVVLTRNERTNELCIVIYWLEFCYHSRDYRNYGWL